MGKKILILGGGFAGLSAGVFLSSKGHEITLIERRGHLGGRAYSYKDPISGATLDNGQHVLMGCYHDTIRFLKEIGTLDRVTFQKKLTVDYAGPGIRPMRFKAWSLPNPFHLLMGLLSFRGLDIFDKVRFVHVASAIRQRVKASPEERASLDQALDKKTVRQWLKELNQTTEAQERFWDVFNLAALNDHPEESSAVLFANVVEEALFAGKDNAVIGIPRVGLSELYVDPAHEYLQKNGATILQKARVKKLIIRERKFCGVELDSGQIIEADVCLSTLPFTEFKKIVPEELLYTDPFFVKISGLKTSPIVSINLWFDRPVTRSTFVGLWGTRNHWLFNKARFFQDKGQDQSHVSLVISGARQELTMPASRLVSIALEELREIFPLAREAQLLHHVVTKEPEATFAPFPGVDSFRLTQETPIDGLVLAGDWTKTGLPGTIEGAVRSARLAIEVIEKEIVGEGNGQPPESRTSETESVKATDE